MVNIELSYYLTDPGIVTPIQLGDTILSLLICYQHVFLSAVNPTYNGTH